MPGNCLSMNVNPMVVRAPWLLVILTSEAEGRSLWARVRKVLNTWRPSAFLRKRAVCSPSPPNPSQESVSRGKRLWKGSPALGSLSPDCTQPQPGFCLKPPGLPKSVDPTTALGTCHVLCWHCGNRNLKEAPGPSWGDEMGQSLEGV